jgi:hypothetical protein
MLRPLTIAGIAFRSQEAAIRHCRAILYGGEAGSEITGEDADFVEGLFCARADKLVNLHGLNVIRYLRNTQPGPFKQTLCFWAELEDGTLVDFSFMTAIDLLAAG